MLMRYTKAGDVLPFMKHTYTILLGIFIVAAFFRFWQISALPPSISWDEAAIGYNAWSILTTGKDEYGTPYPFLFKSFDDYKLPGMIYVTAFSEAVFGLTEFGVRFPSAMFGMGIVIVLYFLGTELFSKNKKTHGTSKTYVRGAIVAGIAAISPWLMSFSRQAFESNASAFFVTLGVLFLTRWGNREGTSRWYINDLYCAALSLSLSIYFYYAARITVPFIVLVFGIVYAKRLFTSKKESIIAAGIGLIILAPLLPHLFSAGGFSRIGQVALTNEPRYKERIERYITYHRQFSGPPQLARVLFSPKKALADEFIMNYLRNISPQFLFYNGAGLHGLMYYWEIPTLLIGLFVLVRKKGDNKWIILSWLLVYPVAASLTKDQPNALRTLIGAPVVVLTSGLGLYHVYTNLRTLRQSRIYLSLAAIVILVSASYYYHIYFSVQPVVRAHDFGDGHKQMVSYVRERMDQYDVIWITGDYWRPYIHILFHMKYDPERYQTTGSRFGIEKIKFGGEWDIGGTQLGLVNLNELVVGKTLFILSDREYRMHIDKGDTFPHKTPIDGVYSPHEFWAVEY